MYPMKPYDLFKNGNGFGQVWAIIKGNEGLTTGAARGVDVALWGRAKAAAPADTSGNSVDFAEAEFYYDWYQRLSSGAALSALTLRARRRARGAALVEMVVVVPLFIVLFASMLFVHHVVAKTLQTQLVARNAAWQSAMSGCSGGAEVKTPDFTSHMDGAPGSEVSLAASSGQATGSSDANVSVSVLGSGRAAAQSGGLSFTQDVHGKAVVMCNARTQPGDIPGAFRWFADGDLMNNIFGGP